MRSAKKRLPINSSAYHVFDVLRLISVAEAPIGVGEVSRRLDLPAPTVHRALTTLEESGYIRRDASVPRYELGLMPQHLTRTLLRRFALTSDAAPVIRQLAAETGETVSLTVRLGWYGLRAAVVYGGNDIYHRDRLAEIDLLINDPAGRCICSCFSKDDMERCRAFVAKHHAKEVHRATERILTQTLKIAAERGFLTWRTHSSAEFLALAFPIKTPTGECIGSIAMTGPILRASSNNMSAPAWAEAARVKLERMIEIAPDRYLSPYAHIDVDNIVIALPRTSARVRQEIREDTG